MHDLALASVSYIFLYHIYTIPQPPTVESAYNAGDPGLIPGSGRSPGEGNGNPLQYSYMENPMDRGAWQGYSPWGLKSLLQHHSLKASILQHSAFFMDQLTSLHDYWKSHSFDYT